MAHLTRELRAIWLAMTPRERVAFCQECTK